MTCEHIRGQLTPDDHDRTVLITDPSKYNVKYYVSFAFCPLCGMSYADEEIEAEAMRNAEKCPDCATGVLRGAPGGGVKCTECSYWFCF